MIELEGDRISDYFAACSRDLTPGTVRDVVRVVYAPVSPNSEVTRSCSSVLSDIELYRAGHFRRPDEQALFIQRRAFRRFCGARASGGLSSLAQANFCETKNGRPYLPELPQVWFSFSACRFGFLGAWSSIHGVGVDCEDPTQNLQAAEIARRYFALDEALVVESLAGSARDRAFFNFWTLKEAALKSIGEGLPFGLEAFEFELEPELRVVQAPLSHGDPGIYSAHIIEGVETCMALVIRRNLN